MRESEIPSGLASAKGLINHILQGQVYDVELGWLDYHRSLRWHQGRQYNADTPQRTSAVRSVSAPRPPGQHQQHQPQT